MIKFDKIKESIDKFNDDLTNNLKSMFKSNVLKTLTASLIVMSSLGIQSANATDLSLTLKSGTGRVSNPDDLGMYLSLNSLKNFDETFLRDNKVTPEQIYRMAKIKN